MSVAISIAGIVGLRHRRLPRDRGAVAASTGVGHGCNELHVVHSASHDRHRDTHGASVDPPHEEPRARYVQRGGVEHHTRSPGLERLERKAVDEHLLVVGEGVARGGFLDHEPGRHRGR